MWPLPTKWRPPESQGKNSFPQPLNWKRLFTLPRLYFIITRRVHITQATLEHLRGEYEVEPGNGHLRNEDIASMGVQTYFIVPPQRRKKTLLFNTLHVRNAMLPAGKRKQSFKMVSSMVMQLLHSIKYSVELPFSNIAQQPAEIQKLTSTKKVNIDSNTLSQSGMKNCAVTFCGTFWLRKI